MYLYARCLIFANFYTYSNNIYVFEILYRISNIVVDSLINVKANSIFIVL